jgi:uncharacterized membrane protein YqjE
MDASANVPSLAGAPGRIAHRVLAIGENRLELLAVEIQEERRHLVHLMALSLAIGVLGLLVGIILTALVVFVLWPVSPVVVLLSLAALYAAGALLLCRRLAKSERDWESLSATVDQIRKDRACLEKILS